MQRTGKGLFSVLLVTMTLFSAMAQPTPQCGIIYVTPGGSTGAGSGTRTNPADLTYGLSQVSATSTVVWLAAGTYTISNELSLPNDVTLEGGFDPISWVKSNGTPTIISRDASNPLPPPADALVGIDRKSVV